MSQLLSDYPLSHAGIRPVWHPQLQTTVAGQTAIRYLRFLQPVRLDHLELSPLPYGRWVPNVPTHPAHLRFSVLDASTGRWQPVGEVDLPYDPRIAGEGLSQQLSTEEMNAHFARVLASPPHHLELGGLQTDHLRVECDREHPVWPSHGETNGGPFNVPFGTLHSLKAFGQPAGDPYPAVYTPPLRLGELRPAAPAGMRLEDQPGMLLFVGEGLSVGFSLRRPLLMHLGWDAHGQGVAGGQRLLASRAGGLLSGLGGLSGPLVRTLGMDCGAHRWGGEVAVVGNRVRYSRLSAFPGVSLDAVFTVEPERLVVELTQRCERPVPVLEAEAWRLAWNLGAGITGAAGLPTLEPGRSGAVALPALWAGDGCGCLSVRVLEGIAPVFQVESHRPQHAVTGGFVLAAQPAPDTCLVLPAGEQRTTIELALAQLAPAAVSPSSAAGKGTASRWAGVFSCFRPELGGFSNHSASIHCHLSQGAPLEVVAHTARPSVGPEPLALARFTVGRALLDGGGYGYHRNLYLDSDPVLLSAAGRLHQAGPDHGWLERVAPGLKAALRRVLATLDEEGLALCRDLSGDSGSHRWSCNGMDVVGFGHLDAYVNAWTYRALRNAAALLCALEDASLARRAGAAADRLRAAFPAAFLNPQTGWVAGWRSRDGQLHDFAFTWVNGVAIAFGLLPEAQARVALEKLEELRAQVGPGSARLGLPCNLLPIAPEDHMLRQLTSPLEPTFETYTDGSLSGWPATYYLRALSLYGLGAQARNLAAELDAGYAAGSFDGGHGSGNEFRSWEGLPTGYEGTLIGCFGPLYAIAIEQGVFRPATPEWWPA